MTRQTPLRPRRTKVRRKSSQPVLAGQGREDFLFAAAKGKTQHVPFPSLPHADGDHHRLAHDAMVLPDLGGDDWGKAKREDGRGADESTGQEKGESSLK